MSVFHFTKLRKHTEKIGSGVTPQGGEASYKSQGIPLIRSQNVRVNRLDLSDVALIDQDQHNKMSGTKVVPGDVLLNITGASIGRSCVVPHNVVESNVNQHVCIIRPKASLDARFLSLFLNSWFGQKQICSFQGGGSREALNFQQIGKFDIPTPPIPEQKAIADLLSTWDEAIEKTERLVKAKEKRFKWLLRVLISDLQSKQNDGGLKVKLGTLFGKDIFVEKGKPLTKVSKNNGVIPVVAGGQSYAYYTSISTHNMSTITISSSGAYAGFVWYHDYPIWASDCNVLYVKKGSTKFLYFLLKAIQHRVYALQSGGAQSHVYTKDIKSLEVIWPSKDLQERIADNLTFLQNEIDILKHMVNKYKTQKHGLMQKMLTGEWRVIPEIVKSYEDVNS